MKMKPLPMNMVVAEQIMRAALVARIARHHPKQDHRRWAIRLENGHFLLNGGRRMADLDGAAGHVGSEVDQAAFSAAKPSLT